MKNLILFLLLGASISASATSYSTTFPLTENPISENGQWINGGTTGKSWTNVAVAGGTPGHAYGTMTNTGPNYADSTAVLGGIWGPNQQATGTVYLTSTYSGGIKTEVELRLNTTISGNSITGYEINCSVNPSDYYIEVVRWNGGIGNFVSLHTAWNVGCKNGDVLKAVNTAGTITVYLNNTLIETVVDNTYTKGSPGIGFYLYYGSTNTSTYGLSSFSATDGNTTVSHQVTLDWTASPDSTPSNPGTVIVNRGSGPCPAPSYTIITMSAISDGPYVDQSVVGGTTYCYYVQAYINQTESPGSNTAQTTIPVSGTSVASPSNLILTSQ